MGNKFQKKNKGHYDIVDQVIKSIKAIFKTLVLLLVCGILSVIFTEMFMQIYITDTAEGMIFSFFLNIVLAAFFMCSYYIGFVYSRKDAYRFEWDQKTKNKIEPSKDGNALYHYLLALEAAVMGISHYFFYKIFIPDNVTSRFLIIVGCVVYLGILVAFNSSIYKNIFPYDKKKGFLLNITISVLLGTILLLYLPYVLNLLGLLLALYIVMKILYIIDVVFKDF